MPALLQHPNSGYILAFAISSRLHPTIEKNVWLLFQLSSVFGKCVQNTELSVDNGQIVININPLIFVIT
jgi:hypothetical protein